MRRSPFLFLLLCLLLLAGCAAPPAASTPTPAPLPAVPRPTDTPEASASAPVPAPTAVAPPAEDVSRYTAALRPRAATGLRLDGLTRYRLDVTLAPGLAGLIGRAEIRYTNREAVALDVIYLHLYPNLWDGGMAVTDVQVAGRPVTVSYPSGDDVAGVPLDPPLAPGATVEVVLRYTVPVPSGEGIGNYGEFALQAGVLALAHFYPTVAVYDTAWRIETPALQGDVIFHDASLYDVTLIAPANLVVAATGASLSRAVNGDGTATWRLAGGPMRDFNIVASPDYHTAQAQVDDVMVTGYFRAEDEAGARQALQWAGEALRVYEQEFGPYPYRELDLAATGTAAAGIEYPGLIVLADRLYSDPARQTLFESVTAHEVAHQWWYNVVGNDQVNAPWLDEALAQYSTYLYYRSVYGAAGGAGFLAALDERWARVDSVERPIGLPVGAYPEGEYSAIVYGRGPLFFVALEQEIGAARMAELLRRHYAETVWGIATPAQFRALAEAVAGQDLGALFKKWVDPS